MLTFVVLKEGRLVFLTTRAFRLSNCYFGARWYRHARRDTPLRCSAPGANQAPRGMQQLWAFDWCGLILKNL